MTEDELRAVYPKARSIAIKKEVKIIDGLAHYISKGNAHIKFARREDADDAIARTDGKMIGGYDRTVHVEHFQKDLRYRRVPLGQDNRDLSEKHLKQTQEQRSKSMRKRMMETENRVRATEDMLRRTTNQLKSGNNSNNQNASEDVSSNVSGNHPYSSPYASMIQPLGATSIQVSSQQHGTTGNEAGSQQHSVVQSNDASTSGRQMYGRSTGGQAGSQQRDTDVVQSASRRESREHRGKLIF